MSDLYSDDGVRAIDRRVNAGHYLVGIEGLALLRSAIIGPRERAEARLGEIRALVTNPAASPMGLEVPVEETDVVRGYARWAATYDVAPNPLIFAEEPVVRGLVDALPPGRALDAACGTGRHTKYLVARGHDVVGVDASDAMLEHARAAVPGVDFRVGDLAALPLEEASVDLAVCSLALTHCPRLEPPLAELARVVRPGGTVIISDMHPFHSALGFTGFFVGNDGTAGAVRSYFHLHADYFAAFAATGLVVRQCLEPRTDETGVVFLSGGMMHLAPDAFTEVFVGMPAALVWELERRA
jgi:ubiquinone/menaquinone biosynthesis C-methylase UbiE